MEQLTLTDDHVDKILEMCTYLFPEYDDTKMYQPPLFGDEKIRLGCIFFYQGHKCVKRIPWYELCVNQIFNAMFTFRRPTSREEEWKMLADKLRQDPHPVDYVYERFKIYKR